MWKSRELPEHSHTAKHGLLQMVGLIYLSLNIVDLILGATVNTTLIYYNIILYISYGQCVPSTSSISFARITISGWCKVLHQLVANIGRLLLGHRRAAVSVGLSVYTRNTAARIAWWEWRCGPENQNDELKGAKRFFGAKGNCSRQFCGLLTKSDTFYWCSFTWYESFPRCSITTLYT